MWETWHQATTTFSSALSLLSSRPWLWWRFCLCLTHSKGSCFENESFSSAGNEGGKEEKERTEVFVQGKREWLRDGWWVARFCQIWPSLISLSLSLWSLQESRTQEWDRRLETQGCCSSILSRFKDDRDRDSQRGMKDTVSDERFSYVCHSMSS